MGDGLLTDLQKAISRSDIKLSDKALLRPLIQGIRQCANEYRDPLSVAGVLLEGTVHLLREVPRNQRKEAIAAVVQLLVDRLATLDMH